MKIAGVFMLSCACIIEVMVKVTFPDILTAVAGPGRAVSSSASEFDIVGTILAAAAAMGTGFVGSTL